jgi:hypothetical protein
MKNELTDHNLHPDGNYQYILVYHDHFKKSVALRPLETKTMDKASYLLLELFCFLGHLAFCDQKMTKNFATYF